MPEIEPAVLTAADSPESGIALTAIVCTYDRYPLLPDAIESLRRQDVAGHRFEIVVVDNSPDRRAASGAAEHYSDVPGLSYVIEPRAGLANARNIGMRKARGRIVAYIDDDARAAPSWADQLIRAHNAFGEAAGAVGGRVVPRWVVPPPRWLAPELIPYLSVLDLGDAMRELAAGEYLCGCNLSFDRAALVSIGGFSLTLGRHGAASSLLSNEELDVCNRLREIGKQIVYAPGAVVEHVIAAERLTQSWFRRRAAWQAVSDLLMTPGRASEMAAAAERQLTQNRRVRHPLGLFADVDDPAAFRRQLQTLSSLVALSLCADAGQSPRRTPLRGLLRRLGFWRS